MGDLLCDLEDRVDDGARLEAVLEAAKRRSRELHEGAGEVVGLLGAAQQVPDVGEERALPGRVIPLEHSVELIATTARGSSSRTI